jgi:hypothetical protein
MRWLARAAQLVRVDPVVKERLRHSDYARLLDFVAGLQEPVPMKDFGAHLVRLTSELLPGATVAFDQIHEAGGQYGFDHNVEIDPAEQARVFARLREVYKENPIYSYIQGGGKGPLVDIAELMPRRDFHRTDFYQDIFRPFGVEHQVNVLLSRPGWINTLTINRDRAIPGRMKTLLELASRHVRLAHRSACLLEQVRRIVPPEDGAGRLDAGGKTELGDRDDPRLFAAHGGQARGEHPAENGIRDPDGGGAEHAAGLKARTRSCVFSRRLISRNLG